MREYVSINGLSVKMREHILKDVFLNVRKGEFVSIVGKSGAGKTTLLNALAGLVNGVYAKSIDGINIVPTFVLTPLVYLGGVFYSAEALPGFWSTVTYFDPVFYVISGFRYGFLGVADVSLAISVGLLLAFAAILLGVAIYLIRTGLGLRQ